MSKLSAKIAEEIRCKGPMTFARFMEWALYCPEYGFYEKEEDKLSRRGDYITSVSVGSLFGQLLAAWMAPRLQSVTAAQQPLVVLEAGAHNAALARDILSSFRSHYPVFLEQGLEYWLLEPSRTRRAWQERKLADFSGVTRWFSDSDELKAACPGGIRGVAFANELLDAIPLHRVGWDAASAQWFEWLVGVDGESFAWCRQEPGRLDPAVARWLKAAVPQPLLEVLPHGFTTEVNPGATAFWEDFAGHIAQGCALTLDYGLETDEFFRPERRDGTVRAYHRHRLKTDLLDCPGDQDLTAHVNWTEIRAAGERAGLKTTVMSSQAQFLTGIAAKVWSGEFALDEWSAHVTGQFKTLTDPQGFGRAFSVLVQEKG